MESTWLSRISVVCGGIGLLGLMACGAGKAKHEAEANPPQALTYFGVNSIIPAGVAIEPLVPTIHDGQDVAYSVYPPLPEGMTLNQTSGIISGTPVEYNYGTYTVTAANSIGSTSALVTFMVFDASISTGATATTQADGKVLLVGGGMAMVDTPSAEIFDPGSSQVSLAGDLATAREWHRAILLQDGATLVVGGAVQSYSWGTGLVRNALASTELFSPASRTWTASGSMGTSRYQHIATLLGNGKVLVAGGTTGASENLASAEIYDPATGQWTPTGSLGEARAYCSATLLGNGQVLVAGGARVFGSAELYDPQAGTWSTTGFMGWVDGNITTTLLADGKVLACGGLSPSGDTDIPAVDAEIFDPATGLWTPTGNLGTGRWGHTATRLQDGRVLVAGGFNVGAMASAEIFDPATGVWTSTGSLVMASWDHTATLLSNGWVLVAGGEGGDVQVYDPSTGLWTWLAGM